MTDSQYSIHHQNNKRMGIAERKEREKQQRREEIIQAAEQVFFSKGFDRSTMDDVAEKAELSKGTLYLYFISKEDLHMAVARKAIRLLRDFTQEAAEGDGSAVEKLGRMGRACIEFSRTHPDRMKAIMTLEELEPMALSASTIDVQEMIYQESTVGSVIELVEQGVQEKEIRSDIPALLVAHTLWMTVLSVIRFVTMKPGLLELLGLSQDQIFASHFELVLNGIRS
ncbi:MAG: TetR/AcrR family transcriptional regulator [Bacteroidia bacterium]|nr:MAG: TetR/AcrR family transcriptional regulator [Bacteroidia bacterium]